MSQPPSPVPAATSTSRPKVLIVGGGIGGLSLGLLLERAGVNYTIFERAATIKPLGNNNSLLYFPAFSNHTCPARTLFFRFFIF